MYMDRALPQKLQPMNDAWDASTWPFGDLQLGCMIGESDWV